jgi:tyrosyl-tRNA synthetase
MERIVCQLVRVGIMAAHTASPGARTAQRELARNATAIVHGNEEADRAERVSKLLFDNSSAKDMLNLDIETKRMLIASAPSYPMKQGESIVDVLVSSGLASSKREAREFITNRAVSLHGVIVDETRIIDEGDIAFGIALLKRGKRNVCVLTLS